MWNVLVTFIGLPIFVRMVLSARNLNCRHILFLGGVIWLRYFLSAYHEFTFPPVLSGLSINALVSIIVVIAGLFIVPKRFWRMKQLVPVYLFLCCIAVSSVISGQYVAFISVLTKWLYFLVIALLTYFVMMRHGQKQVFSFILIALSLPMILLVCSLIFGVAKETEGDGSVSFIGGYNHEAAFSIVVFTFMNILILLDKNSIKFQIPLIIFSMFSLVMVNYRTTLLAAIPVFFVFFWARSITSVEKSQRILFLFILFIVMVLVCATLFPMVSERFSDIAIVIENFRELFKSDLYYSDDEQDLFSARLYIWSQYLTQFFESESVVWIFGFGPDSWKYNFEKYAHNTFVSYLYEFGFFGLITFCAILFTLFWKLSTVKFSSVHYRLLASHVGFLVVNLATMPLWQIEGVIFYGLLSGYSWFYLSKGDFDSKSAVTRSYT